MRLTAKGRELGLVDDVRWAVFERKQEAILREQVRLKKTFLQPAVDSVSRETQEKVLGKSLEHEYSLFELLRRPEVNYEGVINLGEAGLGEQDLAVREQVEIAAKYQGYIDRQKDEIAKQKSSENTKLLDIDYADVHGLSIEARQKLSQFKPETIGQAGRISGITPATISLLLVYLKRKHKKQASIAALPTAEAA
jgi:tRNA uridine 5-carboxymethylaminomethyl modification enzyme